MTGGTAIDVESTDRGRGRGAGGLSVCLSFDFDGPSAWVADTNNPAEISRGEFAAVAVPRILRLLERRGLEATFFVPGHTAYAYPSQVIDIAARGHEIGHHGWAHESTGQFGADEQREFLERGFQALEDVTGLRPVGYRAPSAIYNATTIDLLVEHGFLYDSGFSASDFRASYLRQGDEWSPRDPYTFGTPVDLVELPFAWHLDDWPTFEFLPNFSDAMNSPSHVAEGWLAEADYAYRNAAGGVLVLCMHPEVIGRASRLAMLERFIDHMTTQPGVRFERMDRYAARWREENSLSDWAAQNGGSADLGTASSPLKATRLS